jgi:GNAT superfamily N-acetyltransferase
MTQMIDFDQVSKEELVTFIAENFDLFDSERTPGFPDNMFFDLECDSFQFFRSPDGFAIAFAGQPTEVELMFLHVRKSAEAQGIGVQLVNSVKHMAAGVPVTLKCQGNDRRSYFERRGFEVVRQMAKDRFCMQWPHADPSM